jgi:hypothetical protein
MYISWRLDRIKRKPIRQYVTAKKQQDLTHMARSAFAIGRAEMAGHGAHARHAAIIFGRAITLAKQAGENDLAIESLYFCLLLKAYQEDQRQQDLMNPYSWRNDAQKIECGDGKTLTADETKIIAALAYTGNVSISRSRLPKGLVQMANYKLIEIETGSDERVYNMMSSALGRERVLEQYSPRTRARSWLGAVSHR